MKKSFLLLVILLAFNSIFAESLDVNRAKEFGYKFVKANFEQKENNELDLVYTVNSETGEPCFYVFNVSDYGFIMVSATDLVRPILGYSEDGIFEVDNIAPGLSFMMEDYQEAISYTIDRDKVSETPAYVKKEWKNLSETGMLKSQERGRKIGPLCPTSWDQKWPYNYYCPDLNMPFASNGKAVVGCVATAMSQIMRYWEYPTKGTGSHTYIPKTEGYQYPEQSANFGETTYDWANMPYQIDENSPKEQIEAVGLIGYHCGVAVNMKYDADGRGSGAYGMDVPMAMEKYFGYARSNFEYKMISAEAWDAKIREALEMGRPIFYTGEAIKGGGHAFVCDGMDENGLFHYNYGWSGAGDGYFLSSAIDYPNDVGAIFDIMPKEIYTNTMVSPKNFVVKSAGNNKLSATLTWENPVYTLAGSSSIKNIDKIVIERNGEIIHEMADMMPGEKVTYVDNAVPHYGYFEYSVYAVVKDSRGKSAKVGSVGFGPTCKWQLILQSDSYQGLRGASVAMYDEAGSLIGEKTTVNAILTTYDLDIPLGNVKFVWNPADKNEPSYKLTMVLKDNAGNSIFSYEGEAEGMTKGVFMDTINDCGETVPEINPYDLVCEVKDNSVVLNWGGIGGGHLGYNVFRGDELIATVNTTTYTDTKVPHGGHCYSVSALFDGGNTKRSNEACAVLTENCDPATDLRYELSPALRPKLMWNKPTNAKGITGYYIWRKDGEDGEWIRIKVVSANKTEYTDNSISQFDTWYFYKVVAYYEKIDCMSSPASTQENKDQYVLPFFYSETGVNDNAEQNIGIYPNPANEKIIIDAQNIENVSIFNVMGQRVYETTISDDNMVIDVNDFPTGIYMIHVVTDEYETTKRVSIVH